MKSLAHAAGGVPILARSFLLTLAALCIAVAISITLMLTRPPLKNAPVPLATIVQLLDPAGAAAARPPPSGQPPMAPAPAGVREELRVYALPAGRLAEPPADLDPAAAGRARDALAGLGGFAPEALVVYTRRGQLAPPQPGGPPGMQMLGEGFYVALRHGDGRLTVVESVLQPFPNAFHRQVIALLLLGAALLLPLAWLFSRAIVTPIRRFADAARRVGADPRAAPLPPVGPAEIRDAAESFNAMQARIQRLLEERTEMIAAIAHDLRTPLARLSFRLAELPEPAQRRAAADIDEMTQMIARTLHFCRDRAASQVRDPLDFRLLVEAVVDDYADTGAPVSLTASGSAVIHGDPATLRRAIGNLVDNALKYGTHARLSIELEPAAVVLAVDDDGPGIPQDQQAQALRPFTRLEDSRSRETGGIGLGLTVVRATVLDHGGELAFVNRPDGGLRAMIRLPASADARRPGTRAGSG